MTNAKVKVDRKILRCESANVILERSEESFCGLSAQG